MKRSGQVRHAHLRKREKLIKPKELADEEREREREREIPASGWTKKQKQKTNIQERAPRKNLLPDYLFTLIFQRAEGN